MIRPSTPNDTTALITIAEAIGLQSDEIEVLNKLLGDYFSGSNSQCFWLTDEAEDEVVGVAYCEPERMTDQTWNLQFIAIHPDHQGQGRGGNLLHHIEETLKACGGRLLLVETLASFELTRAFYKKCGYEEEARIRDFYAAGDDKIVYRKVLSV
jgi:ribosomal protein S18 acetylase RimI-like enzyme